MMAEHGSSTIVEGITTGDLDDEVPVAAKSAEERKAAAAMSSLDSRAEDSGSSRDVDQAAIKKAMERLGGPALTNGTSGKQGEDKKVVKKAIKVDAADVNLLIEELELTKFRATDLLRNYDGDLGKALRAYIVAPIA